MRYGIASLLVVGCVSSTAPALHSRSGEVAAGQACDLLSRDLVMKALPDARKKTFEREKPTEDPGAEELRAAGQKVTPGMSCMYGPVILALEPLAQPAQGRSAMQARTRPYEAFEPVPGVGEAAFFRTGRATASMYVFTGRHHFLVEIIAGFMDADGASKPNVIELAKGIVAQLR